MKHPIFFQVKNVYGRILYYPSCETSKKLIKLTDHKTFSNHHMKLLEECGFDIEYVPGWLEGDEIETYKANLIDGRKLK